MIVDLRSLKPNPLRDFTVDPIDAGKVAELKDSIRQDGFWGGVVCRHANSHIEIAAGHHRVEAAKAAGIRTADLYVAEDLDDAGMVRVYARENATQRGNSGSAIAGTVAAAIRFLGKGVMTGGFSGFPEKPSPLAIEQLRGNLASEKGLGEPIITSFLEGVPGVTKNTVLQQLANLKASGDYARIIGAVRDEIEQEQREALKALAKAEAERAEAEARAQAAEAKRKEAAIAAKAAREDAERKRTELARQRAEAEAKLAEKRRADAEKDLKQFEALKQTRDTARKAAEKSAEREKTFDFEGVAQHLSNAHHIDVFRQKVTGEGIRPYLPVHRQASLAAQLVKHAKSTDRELTGGFIREEIMTLLLGTKHAEKRMSDADRQAAVQNDLRAKYREYEDNFMRGAAAMATAGENLHGLLQRWPKALPIPTRATFRSTVQTVRDVLAKLERRL